MRLRNLILGCAVGSMLAVAPSQAAAPSNLAAQAFIGSVVNQGEQLYEVWCCGPVATLTDGSGDPIVGRSITFTADDELLCVATTGDSGTASCDVLSPAGYVAVLTAGGYDASFAGDEEYLAAHDSGDLIET